MRLIIALVLMAVLVTACSPRIDEVAPDVVSEMQGSEPADSSFAVQIVDGHMIPDSFAVDKGADVRLFVTSDERVGVEVAGSEYLLLEGEEVEIGFTADESGTFDIVCSAYCEGNKASLLGQIEVA